MIFNTFKIEYKNYGKDNNKIRKYFLNLNKMFNIVYNK